MLFSEVSDLDNGIIGAGMLICWGLNLAEVMLGFFLAPLVVIGGVGLLQLAYIVPLYSMFRRQGKTATAKGLVIGACVTALLNCACWSVAPKELLSHHAVPPLLRCCQIARIDG